MGNVTMPRYFRSRDVGWLVVATFLTQATPVQFSAASDADADRPTLRVKLITGGEVSGTLLQGSAKSVVLELEGFPCAFDYDRMVADSAYRTRLEVISWLRGGRDGMTPADRFELGLLALRHGRYAIARRDLTRAGRDDPQYRESGQRALSDSRARRSAEPTSTGLIDPSGGEPQDRDEPGTVLDFSGSTQNRTTQSRSLDASRRAEIIDGYKAVGSEIRDRIGSDLVLVETEHFLIWTDWLRSEHAELGRWCEAMYSTLADRFKLDADEAVFAGKCPLFALRSRKRFQEVADILDGFGVGESLGYTSSNSNGHVHVVIHRHGGSPAARAAFASTLVHEGTHAFMHRYRSARHIPSWINEGFADFIAQSVLGDQCSNRDGADMVAAEIAVANRGISRLFATVGPLDARYYPAAHSLVAYLIELDPVAFVGLIDDLKDGEPLADTLDERYHLRLADLEQAWREYHKRR